MKQITQTRFKKGQTEFENISSPETNAETTRIVSLSVNKYGEFQFTTDGTNYIAIEPKILPITSIETIYRDESDLPENQTENTILPAYVNGSLPIKLYKTISGEWVEINEVEEFSFYLPLDTKILYTFLGGEFTPVGVTKTSELTNDAGFLVASDISALANQVATNTNDLKYLPLYNKNEYKAFAYVDDWTSTNNPPAITALAGEAVSRFNDLQAGDKILVFRKTYFTNPSNTLYYGRCLSRLYSCVVTSVSGTSAVTIYVTSSAISGQTLFDRIFAFRSEIPAFETTTSNIKMDGTASVGVLDTVARADHIHPRDTSKQDALSQTQLDAVNSGIDSTKVEQIATNTTNIGTNTGDIATINGKIPSAASSSNQLADKDFVNSSINALAAYYITSNANGDPFATKLALTNASIFYSGGVARIPTTNDYCIVLADESKQSSTGVDPTTRYTYQGGTYPNGQWEYQYTINDTPLTSAQLNAINSGITSSLVTQIGTNQSDISGLQTSKQDKIDSSHKLSADLVEDGTTNKVFTATEQTKLSGIESGAEVNDVEDVKIDGTSVVDGNKNAQISTINGNYNASSNKIATQDDLPANITITTTSGSESVSDGTNTLNFGANAFTSTAIPTTYVSSVNGSSGAITDVAKTNATNTFSAEQTFTGNIKNSGTYYIGSSNAVLSSISGTALTIGDSGATLNLVGSGTLPKYNGNYLANDSDVVHTTGTEFIRGLKTFYTDRPQVYINNSPEQVAVLGDIPTIPPIPTVNDATITITQGGVTKGSFTLNQASNDTIALDAGGSSNVVTDVQVDSTSIVSSGVADLKTINGNYNSSTNKIATASDLPQVNNASLYLQFNGNALKTFTANASSDVTANIQALPNYSLSIGSTNGGNPRQVLFTRVNYTNFDSNSGAYFKLGAMSGHGNGSSYTFVEDVFINVNYQGTVTCNVYKYVQQSVTLDSVTRNYGDIFWTIDTTNKIVDFYILLGQYSSAQFTPATKIGAAKAVTTANGITQYSGTPTYYSSGTKVWATGNSTLYARLSDIPDTSSFVTTNTAQTISGVKTFEGDAIFKGDPNALYSLHLGDANLSTVYGNTQLWWKDSSRVLGGIGMSAGKIYISGTDTSGNFIRPRILTGTTSSTTESEVAIKSEIPDLLSKVYPVGSIYMSVNNTSPASFLGGTWAALQDRFLIGAGNSYSVNGTGGATTVTLQTANMPSHAHNIIGLSGSGNVGISKCYGLSSSNVTSKGMIVTSYSDSTTTGNPRSLIQSNGSGTAHENMPPYLAVYMWKRTA